MGARGAGYGPLSPVLGGEGWGEGLWQRKSEIRSTKSETNSKSKRGIPKRDAVRCSCLVLCFLLCALGLFRISCFDFGSWRSAPHPGPLPRVQGRGGNAYESSPC